MGQTSFQTLPKNRSVFTDLLDHFLRVTISLRSQMLEQSHGTILLTLNVNSRCTPGKYIHIAYLACTFSQLSQVTKQAFLVASTSQPQCFNRRLKTTCMGAKVMNFVWAYRLSFLQKLPQSAHGFA